MNIKSGMLFKEFYIGNVKVQQRYLINSNNHLNFTYTTYANNMVCPISTESLTITESLTKLKDYTEFKLKEYSDTLQIILDAEEKLK